MLAIYKRELGSYFKGMIGYAMCAFCVAISALYYIIYSLMNGLSDFSYYTLYYSTIVFLLFVPVLTMRSLAEERHNKTDQLLLTSPVPVGQIVLGKYLALVTVFLVPCLVDLMMILTITLAGGTMLLANLAGLFCYVLMGSAAIAIGVYCSGLVDNAILAAVITFAIMLVTYFLPDIAGLISAGTVISLLVLVAVVLLAAVVTGLRSRSFIAGCGVFAVGSVLLLVFFRFQNSAITGAFASILQGFSLFRPFEDFINGTFSLKAVVYYLSVSGLFCFLAAQTLEKRRWNG